MAGEDVTFLSKVEAVLSSIEPMIRLEAIPLDELDGRVSAGGMIDHYHIEEGKVLDTKDIEALRSKGGEEALVYSRPKAVIILEAMTKGRSISSLKDICEEEGVVPLEESCENIKLAAENNIGADIVFIVSYGRIIYALLEDLRELGGGEATDLGSAVFMQVGPTPFIVVLDNLEMDEITATVLKEMLGRMSRRRK